MSTHRYLVVNLCDAPPLVTVGGTYRYGIHTVVDPTTCQASLKLNTLQTLDDLL